MSNEQTDARMVADYYRAKHGDLTPAERASRPDPIGERLECIPNTPNDEYASLDAWQRETAHDDITNGFG